MGLLTDLDCSLFSRIQFLSVSLSAVSYASGVHLRLLFLISQTENLLGLNAGVARCACLWCVHTCALFLPRHHHTPSPAFGPALLDMGYSMVGFQVPALCARLGLLRRVSGAPTLLRNADVGAQTPSCCWREAEPERGVSSW